jgi:glutamate synthase domain-containing protein 2
MEALAAFSSVVLAYDWGLFVKIGTILALIAAFLVYVYDRYVQRTNQILVNYPLIGHLRYFFYLIRDPMRQYFGDEKYFDSFDKVEWVNRAAGGKSLLFGYSPSLPYTKERILLRHAQHVLNPEEVKEAFSVTFGPSRPHPFATKSVIGRSAMSDGSISPEATQAFARAAFNAAFPINTGEGGLTHNFLASHRCSPEAEPYLQIESGTWFAKSVYYLIRFFFNRENAAAVYRRMVIPGKESETYSFDHDALAFFRIDWNSALDDFPESVPEDLPDIVFQMGSGLYGVKDREGNFDPDRYRKVMRFCRMTEVKLAQGAKPSGGKLPAEKVTEYIAYYRGVEPYKALISPNRFPYAGTDTELLEFVGTLQQLSGKPVGMKIVVSSRDDLEPLIRLMRTRMEQGAAIPDFITVDGGDGGSGAAPLEMMSRTALPIRTALPVVDSLLRDQGLRDALKLIASEKVLTPDDAVILFALGADFVNIARGFMISAGCIRARHCSGAGGKRCPVGLATMDRARRRSFLIHQKSRTIARYHDALLQGFRALLAVMGKERLAELGREDLMTAEGSDAASV